MMRQDRPATVGDTFTVVHRIGVPAGTVVQTRAPADSSLATFIGAPSVLREGDSVRIAYTIAVWAPGRNELVLPGAVVVHPDGAIDTLPDSRVMLDIASVLPAGEALTRIAPRAARPWLARADRSLLPVAVLLPLLLVALAAWGWWRRRRGPRPATAAPAVQPPPDHDRLRRWLEAGEVTMVADQLAHALIADPRAEPWLARLDAVRFAPADASALRALCDEGLALLRGRAP